MHKHEKNTNKGFIIKKEVFFLANRYSDRF